jgi:hypothetical protein
MSLDGPRRSQGAFRPFSLTRAFGPSPEAEQSQGGEEDEGAGEA